MWPHRDAEKRPHRRLRHHPQPAAPHEHCAQLRLDADTVPAIWQRRMQRDADGVWRVNFGDYVELENLLADLRAAGLLVQELHLQEPDLEDVFTDIMKSA